MCVFSEACAPSESPCHEVPHELWMESAAHRLKSVCPSLHVGCHPLIPGAKRISYVPNASQASGFVMGLRLSLGVCYGAMHAEPCMMFCFCSKRDFKRCRSATSLSWAKHTCNSGLGILIPLVEGLGWETQCLMKVIQAFGDPLEFDLHNLTPERNSGPNPDVIP